MKQDTNRLGRHKHIETGKRRIIYDTGEVYPWYKDRNGTPVAVEPVEWVKIPERKSRSKKTGHAEREHAENSPSGLQYKEACPSFIQEEREEQDEITRSGTRIHEAMEKHDPAGLDDGEREQFEWLKHKEKKIVGTMFFSNGGLVDDLVCITEPFLKTHERKTCGWADRLYYSESLDRAALIDYKTGYWKQAKADINIQFQAYVLGVLWKYPVDYCHVIGLYSRLDFTDEHWYYRKDIPMLMNRISTINRRIEKHAGKEFHPDPNNCFFCGRKADCEAMHKLLLPFALTGNSSLPALTKPQLLTTTQEFDEATAVADLVEKAAVAYRSRMRGNFVDFLLDNSDLNPELYRLVTQNKIKAANTTTALRLAREKGATEEDLDDATTVSLSKLAKSVGRKAERGQMQKEEQRFKDELLEEGGAILEDTSWYLRRNPSP